MGVAVGWLMPSALSRLLIVSTFVTSGLAGLAGVARADDSPMDPAVRNYHLQILATDVVAAGAFVGGNALESETTATGDVMMVGGALSYALGGPIVHIAHGNYGRAAISAGLRVLLPIIGANIGVAFSSCDRTQALANLCYVDDMAAGFLVGAAAAATADNLLVTPWHVGGGAAAPPVSATATRARTTALSLTPRIVATQDHALFGLGGRF